MVTESVRKDNKEDEGACKVEQRGVPAGLYDSGNVHPLLSDEGSSDTDSSFNERERDDTYF